MSASMLVEVELEQQCVHWCDCGVEMAGEISQVTLRVYVTYACRVGIGPTIKIA